MNTLSQVLASIPKLTRDELLQVERAIKAVGQLSRVDPAPQVRSGPDDHLIDLVLDEMRGHGITYPGLAMLRRSRHMREAREKAQVVVQYVDAARLPSRNQKLALMRIGVSLLYGNLQAKGIPVTTVIMIRNLHRIPSLINTAFPGYWRAGLLHLVTGQYVSTTEEVKDVWP